MSELSLRVIPSLSELSGEKWDRLDQGESPFMRYGFLRALEESGSVGDESGWLPAYLLAERAGELVGACATFIKTDSYGEYIFDWSWANAAARAGLRYYPKLTCAAPFTPATGARFLVAPGEDRELVTRALAVGMLELVKQNQLSGAHTLFCTKEESEILAEMGFCPRASFQFHWRNRGYESFEDFLGQLKSRKRKQIRKERRRAQESIDELVFVPAPEMRAEDFEALDGFYRKTVWEHGGFDYLRPGFFEEAAERMPEEMLFARATKKGEVVAGALFYESATALYGRYWGTTLRCEFLHFEVAYYAAIERCIQRGLTLFEAGAQGQHKLLRGFEPSRTYSVHLLRHPDFHRSLSAFMEQEELQVEMRMGELALHGPYRCDDSE